MQERRNCSALAIELRLSCINPSYSLNVSCPKVVLQKDVQTIITDKIVRQHL